MLPNYLSIGMGLVAIVPALFLLYRKSRKFFRKKILKEDWTKDVVYLYQFARLKCIPSISPFALKLETWLRLKNITYESIEGSRFSRGGGQVPFVELNGEEIFDSNVIVPTLQKHFAIEEESSKGGAHAVMRMLDQHTVYSYFWYRYVEHWTDEFFPLWTFPIPGLLRKMLGKMQPIGMRRKGWAVGHGRLPTGTIYELGMADWKALSQFLGSKRFLCGDEITTADCSAFAHLCQILFIPLKHPFKPFVVEHCANLVGYADRMRDELWSDWDELGRNGW